MIIEKTIELQDLQDTMALCGVRDENLEYMREKFGVGIRLFGSNLTITGEQESIERTAEVIETLLSKAHSNNINRNFIDFVTDMIDAGDSEMFEVLNRTVAPRIK